MGRVILAKKRSPNADRVALLAKACLLGGAEVGGYSLWAKFAGSFGGSGVKLQGGVTWGTWIGLFFVSGPLTLLGASMCAFWAPRWAGVWLLGASVARAVLAVLVMMPTPQTWSGSSDGLFH